MELFNVYSLYPVEPVRGLGSHVYDREGREYLISTVAMPSSRLAMPIRTTSSS